MKTHFYVVFLLFSVFTHLSVKAQDFSITANLADLPEHGIVRLYDAGNSTVIDTAVIKDKSFQLRGHFEEAPKSVVLQIESETVNGMGYLFIGNEAVTIKGKAVDLPKNLIITGSEYQDVKTKVDLVLQPFEEKKAAVNQQLGQLYQAEKLTDSIKAIYIGPNGLMKQLDHEGRKAEKQFYAKDPNSYYALYAMNLYKTNFYTDEELAAVMKKVKGKFRQTREYKAIKTHLASKPLKEGEKFADFSALDANGKAVDFNSFFGKGYVLVDFSTPTCHNSMNSRPMLRELSKDYSDKVKIVTYYTENNKDHFNMLNEADQQQWPHLWNTDGGFDKTVLQYRVGATPTYFLFDKKGKLVATWIGYTDATDGKIKSLIK